MQLVIHVVQNRHWRAKDTLELFKNTELTSFKKIISFVCFLQDNASFALQRGSFVPLQRAHCYARGYFLGLRPIFARLRRKKYYSTSSFLNILTIVSSIPLFWSRERSLSRSIAKPWSPGIPSLLNASCKSNGDNPKAGR